MPLMPHRKRSIPRRVKDLRRVNIVSARALIHTDSAGQWSVPIISALPGRLAGESGGERSAAGREVGGDLAA
jgi:hypothetical protein